MSMTPDEMIAVIQAHKEGKQVQIKSLHNMAFKDWTSITTPLWDFASYEYRIGPRTKILKWQWLYTDYQGDLTITSYFYANETVARKGLQSSDTLIGKAAWTQVEVDA